MGKIYSAIDIGSNAIRMLIAEINFDTTTRSHYIREIKKIRSPVRLGKEVFLDKPISAKTMQESLETFEHFKNINTKYAVQMTKAVATSALREAKNKFEFIDKIEKKTNIKIELIDGFKEAELIFLAVQKESNLSSKKVVLVDIGGGSVEVTLVENSKMIATHSFPLGTVRILDQLLKRNMNESHLKIIMADQLGPVSNFISNNRFDSNVDFATGTGGNLECMARLKWDILKRTSNSFITLEELVDIYSFLEKLPLKDRIEKLNLRPDRADVILPAILTIKMILRQCEANRILIPRVGLRNGLLWSMVLGPS